MLVHNVRWATGVRYAAGYIEDTALGQRHAADPRLQAVCLHIQERPGTAIADLRHVAAAQSISPEDFSMTLRELIRRGLLDCNARPADGPSRSIRRRAVYWHARFVAGVPGDLADSLRIRSRARRYDIYQPAGALFVQILRAATAQAPLLFLYGVLAGLIAVLYGHAPWYVMVLGVPCAWFTITLHEWAHAMLVRRFALPGILIALPQKLTIRYRGGTAKQQAAVSAAGPLLPSLAWLLLGLPAAVGSVTPLRAAAFAWLVVVLLQAMSLLPGMKDGAALWRALRALFIKEKRSRHVAPLTNPQK